MVRSSPFGRETRIGCAFAGRLRTSRLYCEAVRTLKLSRVFRSFRIGETLSVFILVAFSLREPVPTSLENAPVAAGSSTPCPSRPSQIAGRPQKTAEFTAGAAAQVYLETDLEKPCRNTCVLLTCTATAGKQAVLRQHPLRTGRSTHRRLFTRVASSRLIRPRDRNPDAVQAQASPPPD